MSDCIYTLYLPIQQDWRGNHLLQDGVLSPLFRPIFDCRVDNVEIKFSLYQERVNAQIFVDKRRMAQVFVSKDLFKRFIDFTELYAKAVIDLS